MSFNEIVFNPKRCKCGPECGPIRVNISTSRNCEGVTLTANATGGTPPYSYLWSTGATTQSITVNIPGDYAVTARDSNLCPSEGAGIVIVESDLYLTPSIGSVTVTNTTF